MSVYDDIHGYIHVYPYPRQPCNYVHTNVIVDTEATQLNSTLCPLPRKYLYFLHQNGEFLCIPGDIH